MVGTLKEKFRMATGRHIWTMTDHEYDGFQPTNLNSTTPASTYDKFRTFDRPHSLLGTGEKEISNQHCQHFQDTDTKMYHN
jgi:hypothetical protein